MLTIKGKRVGSSWGTMLTPLPLNSLGTYAGGRADTSLLDGSGSENSLKWPSKTKPGKAKRSCLGKHESMSASSGLEDPYDSVTV